MIATMHFGAMRKKRRGFGFGMLFGIFFTLVVVFAVYAGMLGESLQLENLYRLHNLDDRPLPYGMHALSVSDIVIRNEKGNSTAYYVDDLGFKEIPGFAARLKEERIRQGVKICHER